MTMTFAAATAIGRGVVVIVVVSSGIFVDLCQHITMISAGSFPPSFSCHPHARVILVNRSVDRAIGAGALL